ncbi:hypothetical protein EDB85DRAFT_1920719 [Lactarius pseudohatsudake]|nr:hypothetical protein EDB85DRAFT_1920719 [Lactarius pseudohatsudake]
MKKCCVLSLAIFLYSPRSPSPVHPKFSRPLFKVTLVSCTCVRACTRVSSQAGSPRVCVSDFACCMYSQLVLSTHFYLHLFFVVHFSTIHTMYP